MSFGVVRGGRRDLRPRFGAAGRDPWGRELRGEQFHRARAYVADVFGELT
jgi:hypothetical protein